MLNKLERQAADVLKTKSLLRSEQELRQKLDKLDPAVNCDKKISELSLEKQVLVFKVKK